MRKLEIKTFPEEKNALCYWKHVKNPFRVFFNTLIMEIARFMPSLRLKRGLYRLTGMKIGGNAAIAYRAMFDIFFPELIEIGENTIIGYNTTVLAHEFLNKEFRKGRVRIGKNVMVGANCTILPGVSIGDNAIVSAMTLVNKDVPVNALAGGIPVKIIKKKIRCYM